MATDKDKINKSAPETTECGLIMPISALDECSEQHWVEVRDILSDAIRDAKLEPNIVSDADDVGIIQKRIIQNLYSNPIVVCDVSGKNPNVMFELGLRLAFDKPTIIVKDDKTSYSFDTSPIEHLTYPRDLRFNQITKFKKDLASKLTGTLKAADEDPNYTTFLKNFGEFTVAKLDTTEVSKEQFIIEELRELRRQITHLGSRHIDPSYEFRKRLDENLRREHPLDREECERCLREAILSLASLAESDPSRSDVLTNASEVMRRCKDMGSLPFCFTEGSGRCSDRFDNIFSKVMANKAPKDTDRKSVAPKRKR